MKYFLIAGEASGDLYGSLLMESLKSMDKSSEFQYWGGDKMKAVAVGQLKTIQETSIMGFWEVAKNIVKIKDFFRQVKKSILQFKPDILILIDYPGFNLRISKWAKENNIKIAYYISPQLWAWKKNRYKILKDNVDLFFVILPFETEFYSALNTPAIYCGHPLLEIIKPSEKKLINDITRIGLFPGSREQEIVKHLETLVQFSKQYPRINFVIAGVNHINKHIYEEQIGTEKNINIVFNNSYDVMSSIDFAISSSGTATLELALFEVPQIVIYKTSLLSYQIGKRLINTKFISLVNLIAGKKIVPELIQEKCNLESLNVEFEILKNLNEREDMRLAYKQIRSELGEGSTSIKVAKTIYEFLA